MSEEENSTTLQFDTSYCFETNLSAMHFFLIKPDVRCTPPCLIVIDLKCIAHMGLFSKYGKVSVLIIYIIIGTDLDNMVNDLFYTLS
jgi:hypothetical protein